MIHLAIGILIFGALWFVVVWSLFGAWSWYERERLWRGIRRAK